METSLEEVKGSEKIPKMVSEKVFEVESKEEAPRLRGNHSPGFFSSLLFNFVDPLVKLGRRVRLEKEDLLLRPDMNTRELYERFGTAWDVEKTKPEPRILKPLIAGTWRYLVFTGILYAISLVLQFVGPLMVNKIVAGLTCRSLEGDEERDCPSKGDLYKYAAVLFVAPVGQALAESHMFYQMNLYGTRLRNGLMAAIYR